jgi:hypothetical protein
MMITTNTHVRLERPQRIHFLARWQLWATIGMLIAVYFAMYFGVRTRHQAANHELDIDTGSRIADRLFAPLIGAERAWFERKIPNADTLIKSAFGEAELSGRKVLLVFGTQSCLPCRQLERLMDEQQSILSRYFIILKIDIDGSMLHGSEVHENYRNPHGSLGEVMYMPWMAVLDGAGAVLVTSDDGPEGAIGLPHGGPVDRAWFLQLLRKSNPKITDDEIATLDAAALGLHNEIWSRNTSR